jgi:hypothetical protein
MTALERMLKARNIPFSALNKHIRFACSPSIVLCQLIKTYSCFAHITNLACQDVVRAMGELPLAVSEARLAAVQAHLRAEAERQAREGIAYKPPPSSEEELCLARNPITAIRALVNAVHLTLIK